MKRLFLVFVFSALVFVLFSQEDMCRYAVSEIVNETNGIIVTENTTDAGQIAIIVEIDSYFDRHLVSAKVNRFARTYNDIRYLQAFKAIPDLENTYFAVLDIAGTTFTISYIEDYQRLIFFFDKDTDAEVTNN